MYAEQFQEGELDLRAHLLKIKALKPEALMISAQSQDFARGLVQSYEVGVPPSVKRIGGSAASNRPRADPVRRRDHGCVLPRRLLVRGTRTRRWRSSWR